jgi:cyclic pyranopterin phosphate synthase
MRSRGGEAGTSHVGRVGFIGAISERFCETCNRIRIGADGTLRACLGRPDRVALRPLLPADREDGLLSAILGALHRKPKSHEMRSGALDRMVAIGG